MSNQHSDQSYDRKKVRRAILLAPLFALFGIVPYFIVLNLSMPQMLVLAGLGVVLSYIGGVLLGAPGYLLLKAMGKSQSIYLMGYAAALIGLLAVVLQDTSVLISIGPPVILAAGAFCWLRGPASSQAAYES